MSIYLFCYTVQMKTLIINNHSKYTTELSSFFPGATIIDKEKLTDAIDISNYDLLVFSGGSNGPTVLRHPEEYIFEIDLVKKSTIPMLGICLGTEIIVEAFDGELQELSRKHEGGITLKIEDTQLKSQLGTDELVVAEGHRIGVKMLPAGFISCASSEHGIEIIKHLSKPIVGFQFHPEVSNNKKLFDWAFEKLGLR